MFKMPMLKLKYSFSFLQFHLRNISEKIKNIDLVFDFKFQTTLENVANVEGSILHDQWILLCGHFNQITTNSVNIHAHDKF